MYSKTHMYNIFCGSSLPVLLELSSVTWKKEPCGWLHVFYDLWL